MSTKGNLSVISHESVRRCSLCLVREAVEKANGLNYCPICWMWIDSEDEEVIMPCKSSGKGHGGYPKSSGKGKGAYPKGGKGKK